MKKSDLQSQRKRRLQERLEIIRQAKDILSYNEYYDITNKKQEISDNLYEKVEKPAQLRYQREIAPYERAFKKREKIAMGKLNDAMIKFWLKMDIMEIKMFKMAIEKKLKERGYI